MWINLERGDLDTAIRCLRSQGRKKIANRLEKHLLTFAQHENSETTAIHRSAYRKYHNEGSIEVDPSAVVSEVDEGAYVMGWLWVDRPEIEIEITSNSALS